VKLHTCSEVVSFIRDLENTGSSFYENLARELPNHADTFSSFVKENKKNIAQIERVYYGVITDAIEGCFAFDVETEQYQILSDTSGSKNKTAALEKAVSVEKKMQQFYATAAEQSKALMADLPRTFFTIAKKRDSRIASLTSLLK